MAEMLLINPRRRRRAAKASARRTPAKRRAPARRRRNPAAPVSSAATTVRRAMRRAKVRRNPIRSRRRRNPINLGSKLSTSALLSMFKDAAIGGAGAVGIDVLMGKLNPHLPASLQTSPNSVGVGDAVKAAITAILGTVLNKATKGLARKAAIGALTTQVRDIISMQLPAGMVLGYATPGRMIPGNARVSPNRVGNVAAFTRPGSRSPLLSAYVNPGSQSPLLNSAAAREGVRYR